MAVYNFPEVSLKRDYKCDYKCIQNLEDAKLQCLKSADTSIDCQLGISKSKLGALTDKNTGIISPASVVYLSLSFRQPEGCKLSTAAVSITLVECNPAEKDDFEQSYSHYLCVTDYYAPKNLIGERKTETTTKEYWIKP